MSPTTPQNRAHLPGHKLAPFTWRPDSIDGFPNIGTLETIKSLAGGVACVLEIIEADDQNEGDPDTFGAVLDAQQTGALLRLAIAVSAVIEEQCDEAFEWSQKHGLKAWRRVPFGTEGNV